MKSLADRLPPEIARQIHPDWRKNEAAYWTVRDQLAGPYQGQWIAFADGAVIAACKTSLEVLHTPGVLERHPFVICVGREDEPYRIRRATFAYDPTYPGQALPLLSRGIGDGFRNYLSCWCFGAKCTRTAGRGLALALIGGSALTSVGLSRTLAAAGNHQGDPPSPVPPARPEGALPTSVLHRLRGSSS